MRHLKACITRRRQHRQHSDGQARPAASSLPRHMRVPDGLVTWMPRHGSALFRFMPPQLFVAMYPASPDSGGAHGGKDAHLCRPDVLARLQHDLACRHVTAHLQPRGAGRSEWTSLPACMPAGVRAPGVRAPTLHEAAVCGKGCRACSCAPASKQHAAAARASTRRRAWADRRAWPSPASRPPQVPPAS